MSKAANRAPASVAENVETVLRVENETLRPRSGSEAITEAIGGFVGTISFVVAQLLVRRSRLVGRITIELEAAHLVRQP